MRKKYRMNFQIYFNKGDDADCGVVFLLVGIVSYFRYVFLITNRVKMK